MKILLTPRKILYLLLMMYKRLKFTIRFTSEVLIAIFILSTLYFFSSCNKLKEKNCRQLVVILNQPLISPKCK